MAKTRQKPHTEQGNPAKRSPKETKASKDSKAIRKSKQTKLAFQKGPEGKQAEASAQQAGKHPMTMIRYRFAHH